MPNYWDCAASESISRKTWAGLGRGSRHLTVPVVYEAYTDPDVPTLPPHISFKMAAAYSSALLKGDPEEGGIIKQTIKDAAATILPHKEKK